MIGSINRRTSWQLSSSQSARSIISSIFVMIFPLSEANLSRSSSMSLRRLLTFPSSLRSLRTAATSGLASGIMNPFGTCSLPVLCLVVRRTVNTSGKIVVNKQPDGARSPNKADSVVMAFATDIRRGLRML